MKKQIEGISAFHNYQITLDSSCYCFTVRCHFKDFFPDFSTKHNTRAVQCILDRQDMCAGEEICELRDTGEDRCVPDTLLGAVLRCISARLLWYLKNIYCDCKNWFKGTCDLHHQFWCNIYGQFWAKDAVSLVLPILPMVVPLSLWD